MVKKSRSFLGEFQPKSGKWRKKAEFFWGNLGLKARSSEKEQNSPEKISAQKREAAKKELNQPREISAQKKKAAKKSRSHQKKPQPKNDRCLRGFCINKTKL